MTCGQVGTNHLNLSWRDSRPCPADSELCLFDSDFGSFDSRISAMDSNLSARDSDFCLCDSWPEGAHNRRCHSIIKKHTKSILKASQVRLQGSLPSAAPARCSAWLKRRHNSCVTRYVQSAAVGHAVTSKSVGTNRKETDSSFLAINSTGNDVPATRYASFQFILLRFQNAYSRFKFRISRFLSKRRRHRSASSRAFGEEHGIVRTCGNLRACCRRA